MQSLIHSFLQQRLSRRGLTEKLAALGLSMSAAQSLVEPLKASEDAGKGLAVPGSKTMRGTGGELVMEQAKAAGAEYLFTNPGSFEVGFSMRSRLHAPEFQHRDVVPKFNPCLWSRADRVCQYDSPR